MSSNLWENEEAINILCGWLLDKRNHIGQNWILHNFFLTITIREVSQTLAYGYVNIKKSLPQKLIFSLCSKGISIGLYCQRYLVHCLCYLVHCLCYLPYCSSTVSILTSRVPGGNSKYPRGESRIERRGWAPKARESRRQGGWGFGRKLAPSPND